MSEENERCACTIFIPNKYQNNYFVEYSPIGIISIYFSNHYFSSSDLLDVCFNKTFRNKFGILISIHLL